MTSTATLEPAADAVRHSGDQKIETIREILVGDHMQTLNQRFKKLEKKIESHHSKVDDELMTRFETLQVFNKSAVDELGNSVVEMVGQLREEDNALSEETKACTKRLGELEKRVDDMRVALTEHVRKMHEEVSAQLAEFSSLIKSQQDDVARQSVSRKDFAKILNGLAGTLAQQESEPEGLPLPKLTSVK